MKTLSIKQPWADLVVDGKKTIETRVWNTRFRGEFYIHASMNPDKKACKRLNVTPSATGAIIGKAFLESVKRYDFEEEWEADHNKHLADQMKKTPMYGYLLKNTERTSPIPAKGSLGFWEWKA